MADTTIHEIVPDYDTVIVLTYPCYDFAPWNPDHDGPALGPSEDLEMTGDATSVAADADSSSDSSDMFDFTTPTADLVDATTQTPAIVDTYIAHESEKEDAYDGEIIHYRISSRHLTLTSPWFERALTSPRYLEAVPDPTDGLYYINACDWDEDALHILLNAIHLRAFRVPKTVSLEMLAKIAVLIDYYELCDDMAWAFGKSVGIWTQDVRHWHTIPDKYC
jgi:hypothetical protein